MDIVGPRFIVGPRRAALVHRQCCQYIPAPPICISMQRHLSRLAVAIPLLGSRSTSMHSRGIRLSARTAELRKAASDCLSALRMLGILLTIWRKPYLVSLAIPNGDPSR